MSAAVEVEDSVAAEKKLPLLHVVCGQCGPKTKKAVCGFAVNDIFRGDDTTQTECVVCAEYEAAPKCPHCGVWWRRPWLR